MQREVSAIQKECKIVVYSELVLLNGEISLRQRKHQAQAITSQWINFRKLKESVPSPNHVAR
jgi:hypothetical protein